MSDPVLAAVQKFMDAVETRLTAHKEEVRSMLADIETRSVPSVVEGPPGPPGEKGDPGERGADSTVPGPVGPVGERGADGIGTREALDEWFEQRFADLQVRTFADVYHGVYENNKHYTRGMVVTWDGSLHLAQKDTNAKPGLSPDWKLIVKRGRDR